MPELGLSGVVAFSFLTLPTFLDTSLLPPADASTIPFFFPDECKLIPPVLIKRENRSRTDFSGVPDLAESIKKHGLIHPPTLSADYVLIAGECRLNAMLLLQSPLIPCIFRESLTPAAVAEMELVENFQRRGMKWQEAVLNIHKIHKLRKTEALKTSREWLQKETGQLLGYTHAHVSNALKVAQHLLLGDEEVIACDGIRKALDLLTERALNLAVQERAQRNSTSMGITMPSPQRAPGSPFVINLGEDTNSGSMVDQAVNTQYAQYEKDFDDLLKGETSPDGTAVVSPAVDLPQKLEMVEVDFSDMFILGDSIDVMYSLPSESVDHIVTDPPYAIEMSNLKGDIRFIELTEAEHDVEENLALLPMFLRAAYHVLKANAFCVFWYDIEHHQFLIDHAKAAGFTVQRWPLTWVKTHTCKNGAPFHNFTKATEVALVCRKGSPKLVKPATKNFILADGLAERKLYDHPFVKPREVWNFILEHIAFSGQTILDPFAGQFSCPRAVMNLGMRPLAIEKHPYHFLRGVTNMEKLFKEMSMGRVVIKNDPRINITPEMLGAPPTETSDDV